MRRVPSSQGVRSINALSVLLLAHEMCPLLVVASLGEECDKGDLRDTSPSSLKTD
jgi:hypothetical protein